ncbi:MAG: hypothetical protein ACE5F1_20185 [Planctomycetota bacterium]
MSRAVTRGCTIRSWGTIPLPLELSALGLSGCKLFISPDFLYQLMIMGGRATWVLPIPNDVLLVGLSFFQQGLVLDRAANSFGAIMTNAGKAKIGVR